MLDIGLPDADGRDNTKPAAVVLRRQGVLDALLDVLDRDQPTQPSVGGPIYWIRNIVYNAPGGSTRSTAGSPGVIFYHNTVTTETSVPSGAIKVPWFSIFSDTRNSDPPLFVSILP